MDLWVLDIEWLGLLMLLFVIVTILIIGSRHLQYDSSWNDLMPVVEKIGKLYEKAFPSNEEFIKRIMQHNDPIDKEYIDVISISVCTPIDEVYKAVVDFIKWYNAHK